MSIPRADATVGTDGVEVSVIVSVISIHDHESKSFSKTRRLSTPIHPNRFSVLLRPLGCKRIIQTPTMPRRVGLSIKQMRSNNPLQHCVAGSDHRHYPHFHITISDYLY